MHAYGATTSRPIHAMQFCMNCARGNTNRVHTNARHSWKSEGESEGIVPKATLLRYLNDLGSIKQHWIKQCYCMLPLLRTFCSHIGREWDKCREVMMFTMCKIALVHGLLLVCEQCVIFLVWVGCWGVCVSACRGQQRNQQRSACHIRVRGSQHG